MGFYISSGPNAFIVQRVMEIGHFFKKNVHSVLYHIA